MSEIVTGVLLAVAGVSVAMAAVVLVLLYTELR